MSPPSPTSWLKWVRARLTPVALIAGAAVVAGLAGAYIAARLRLERVRRQVSLRSFPSTVARHLHRRPRGAPRGPRRRRGPVGAALAGIAVVAALLAGCAPAGLVRAPSPAALARLGPIPDTYSAPVTQLADSVNARAREVFEGAISPAARAFVVHDAALDRVAAVYAETVSDERRDTIGPVVTWLTWRAGSTSMFFAAQGRWARGEGAVAILDQELTRIARQLGGDAPRAYGVARFSSGSMAWQAVVFGRRPHTEVRLLRKAYAPGEPIAVRIAPRPEHTGLVMLLSCEGEAVAEHRMTAEPDGTFSAAPPAPSRPGRYFVEIVGTPASGAWRSLLWLPVFVGVPEPTAPDEVLRAPRPNPGSADAWPAWLVAVYNAERARLGLAPLRLDEGLCAAAQQRARERARHNGAREEIAGSGASQPAAGRRREPLAWSGWRGRFAWSGAFEVITDVVTMQMERPIARHGLLDPGARRFGVGFAPRKRAGGGVKYEIVEYVR